MRLTSRGPECSIPPISSVMKWAIKLRQAIWLHRQEPGFPKGILVLANLCYIVAQYQRDVLGMVLGNLEYNNG